VLIAMINVVISLYYYILIVRAAYFLEPKEDLPGLSVSGPVKLLTGVLVAAMVIIGIFPRYVIDIALAASKVLL
jgi:NADH-quinone oxidoreductase subunit N